MHSMYVGIPKLRLSLIIVYLRFSVIIRSFNTSNRKLTSRTSICLLRNDINNLVYLFRQVGQKIMSRFFVKFLLQYSQWREAGSSLTRCSTFKFNLKRTQYRVERCFLRNKLIIINVTSCSRLVLLFYSLKFWVI